MHLRLFVLVFTISCLGLFPLFAQVTPQNKKEKIRQALIERLVENQESSSDYTDLIDQIDYFFEDPLNLNTATEEQLRLLGLLNEFQIQSILQHRKTYGDFLNVRELQVIGSINRETLSFLIWMTTVRPSNWGKTLRFKQKDIHQNLVSLTQFERPMSEGHLRRINGDTIGKSYYLGNPLKQSIRYKVQAGRHWQFHLAAEKDDGEPFGGKYNSMGFDFWSAHLLLKNVGVIKQWVVGDFNCTWGQGLTLGTGLAFGKSALVLNVKRNFQGIRPYRSVNENEFLRGSGIELSFSKWEISMLGSIKKEDANVIFDSLQSDEGATGILTSGFHRTPSDFQDKKALGRALMAGRIKRKLSKGHVSISGVYQQFEVPFAPGTKPYDIYAFSGNRQARVGMDYEYWIRESHFFGEFSIQDEKGWATVHGWLQSVGQKADFIFFYRRYQANFKPLLTAGFGESSSNINEEGLYTGWVFKPTPLLTCSLMADVYRFPWLRYLVNIPQSHGMETLGELTYNPSRNASVYLRIRQENKYQEPGNSLWSSQRKSARIHAQVKTTEKIILKTRAEWVVFNDNSRKESGFMAYQDIQYEARKWEFTLRCAYFKTDGFYSRIYAYENDMLYTFSVPALQGEGLRAYMLYKLRVTKKLGLWFRYAMTYLPDAETRGSGLEESIGPWQHQFKFQIVWNQ